jgi:hypothetical protein
MPRGVHLPHAAAPYQSLHLEATSDERPFGERASLRVIRHLGRLSHVASP